VILVQQLAEAVSPWAEFYNASPAVQSAVKFAHLGGILTAAGFAIAADRATILVSPADPPARTRHLGELAQVHPIVLGGLLVAALSGLLLLTADLEALVAAPAFWIKMGLIALLLGNGALMVRSGRELELRGGDDPAEWSRLRRAAAVSLVLWFAVVLAGSILSNVS
jgi:hypothetical protein